MYTRSTSLCSKFQIFFHLMVLRLMNSFDFLDRYRLPEVKLDLAILFQLFDLNVAARVLLDDYLTKGANVNDLVLFLTGKVLLEHSLGKLWSLLSRIRTCFSQTLSNWNLGNWRPVYL